MPNVEHESDLMPTAEVAEYLGRDVRTITRWVEAGRLAPAFKAPGLRGVRLFRREDVEALRDEVGA